MSSDPQEIAPGLWVSVYCGPVRAEHGTRKRWQLWVDHTAVSLSYEQMCALRAWFAVDVTAPRSP